MALFCSHTKAAAQTAVDRWGQKTGRMDISTIHSHCFRSLGLSMSQTLDDDKKQFFVSQFGMDMEEGSDAHKYFEIIDLAANLGLSVSDAYARSVRPGTMGHFLAFTRSYQQYKDQFGYMDFTDMLAQYPIRVRKPAGHSFLVVDEAQDMTPLHWKVIEHYMTLNPKAGVLIAGDDDQCVYGHTGASAAGMMEFSEKHNAEVKILGQSYRVPRAVHALAQSIAGRIRQRVDKEYLPKDADGLVQTWGEFQWGHSAGRADRDTLILYSDRFVRKDVVEPALLDRGVLYTATSGFPSPLQTVAGKAMRTAYNPGASREELQSIRRGLSPLGQSIFDSIGAEAVCEKLRKFDYKLLRKIHWTHEDYYRRVDWRNQTLTRISTIHGAKGMEALDVHLVTGQSPSALAQGVTDPDARHRLFYVGVTRAAERLYLYGGDNAYDMPRANQGSINWTGR
jgi:superfamily I DNA/RNA helicase